MVSATGDDFGLSSPAVRFAQDAMLIGTVDGYVVDANPAASLMFGRGIEELRGVSGDVLIAHVDEHSAMAWANRVAAGRFRGEVICRRADGTLFETDVSGRLFTADDGRQYTSISVRDISAQRAAERALGTSEQRYRRLVETLDEGVVYQDANGVIIASNPAAERILGLTADQLAGRTSLDPRWRAVREDGSPFPGEDHPGMVALRSGELTTGIMGVHKPDGTLTWISIRARPVQAAGADGPEAVVATFTDITEQRAAAEERERISLELAHRLRSLALLLGMAEQIALETDADRLRSALTAHAITISGAEHCAFLQWDSDERTLITVSSTTPEKPIGQLHLGHVGPRPYGISGMAIEQLRPVVTDDYATMMADQPDADGHRLGARAAAAIPLQFEGRVLGVFVVWSTERGVTFDQQVIDNLRLLGGLASAAFVGLERTQLATVAMSARALLHRVNNHLAIAMGTLDVGVDVDRLSEQDRAALVQVNAELVAAAEHIVQFARVRRIQTVTTPAGTALDIDASTGSQ